MQLHLPTSNYSNAMASMKQILSMSLALLLLMAAAAAQANISSSGEAAAAQVNAIILRWKRFISICTATPNSHFMNSEPQPNWPSVSKALGYETTTGVGGTGIVGVMKIGAGPTVMLRTELDALPIQEKTVCPSRAQSW